MAAFFDGNMCEWLAKQASVVEGKAEAWVTDSAAQLAGAGFVAPRDLVTLNVGGRVWVRG